MNTNRPKSKLFRLLRQYSILIAVLSAACVPAHAAEEVVTFESRPGVTQSLLFLTPDTPPKASLILYVGSGGAIGLRTDWRQARRGNNFLFRSADLFVQAGFQVAVIDAPSDSPSALWNLRSHKAHAEDTAAAIAFLRRKAAIPVWLIGTSMGTVSVANAAARLQHGGPDGIVLTSSVTLTTKRSSESVLSVDLDEIRVPMLVVNHLTDSCPASPPHDAQRILDKATNSPRQMILSFSGGKPSESDECEPFSSHGYYGIEPEVVTAIIDWIK